MSKLWGGRFEGPTDQEVEAFTTSLAWDTRLAAADLEASRAHAQSIAKAGVLTAEEGLKLVSALESLLGDLATGKLRIDPTAEDIHSEIERWLGEKVGDLAGKLHTGRSRNDQVATATRLYLRDAIDQDITEIRELQTWLVEAAEKNLKTLLPGMTHLQHAQPVSLAHHLLAYFWMLERDRQRLSDCRKRVNQLPLGSGALAGTPYPVDRAAVAAELEFEGVCENSLDAVSDRDFVVEYLSAGSLILVHLSRLAEEIILWSTPEFGFVTLADSVTTGSSLMPQKKNPDVAELIRGRVGRLVGSLMGALTMLKGLPLAYNRDLQEDKVHLFQGVDTVRSCVRLSLLTLKAATFHPERMRKALAGDFSNATELADYLVHKGLPFRQAHEVVGKAVNHCVKAGIALESLTTSQFQTFSTLIGADVGEWLKPERGVEARSTRGGTGTAPVLKQIEAARLSLRGA